MEILARVRHVAARKKFPENIKLLAGEPLIAYTIREAQKSRFITRIVVSTEIARISRELGAELPFMRSTELAADDVLDLPVFQHGLRLLRDGKEYSPDIIVHLRPTAPLRTALHIDKAIELFLSSRGTDCVRSVSPTSEQPLKIWRVEDSVLNPYIPTGAYGLKELYNMPRQKLPPDTFTTARSM